MLEAILVGDGLALADAVQVPWLERVDGRLLRGEQILVDPLEADIQFLVQRRAVRGAKPGASSDTVDTALRAPSLDDLRDWAGETILN